MKKSDLDQIHGKLEVRAKRDTKRGNSGNSVPAGTIGYASTWPKKREWHVFWPHLEPAYKGDWRTSVHDPDDLEPTGKRGDRKDFAFRK